MLTKQDILDKIDKEFKGKAVINGTSSCQYLTGDGRKCAIGLFIPDGHIAQSSRSGVYFLLDSYPDLVEHMPSKNIQFLTAFQSSHDYWLDNNMPLDKQKEVLKKFINVEYDKYDHSKPNGERKK